MHHTVILDLCTAVWVITVFYFLFLCLPSLIFYEPKIIPWKTRVVSGLVRMVLITVIGILTLITLGLFSWFSLVLLYAGCFLVTWLHYQNWQVKQQLQQMFQRVVSVVLDSLDSGFLPEIKKVINRGREITHKRLFFIKKRIGIATPEEILGILALTFILTFAVLLRFEHPLQELRLGNPDNYGILLTTRQLLSGVLPKQIQSVAVFSPIAVVVSLLGSIDAMEVVRFLGPILGLLLVLSVGYCVGTLTNNGVAALVSIFILGVYLFTSKLDIPEFIPDIIQQWLGTITASLNTTFIQQWAGSNLEIGVIFLLLGLTRMGNIYWGKYRFMATIDTFCCVVIIAVAAPTLLIFMLLGAISFIGGGRLTLTVISITWIMLGLLFAIPQNQLGLDRSFLVTLPVALSLLGGVSLIFTGWLMRPILNKWSESICFIIVVAISINFLLPLPPKITYVEYDVAARKSLELRSKFPKKRWILAAPIEQLSIIYGTGWYEDLAVFVEKHGSKVNQVDFNFSYAVPDLLVFVEKRPFITFTDNFQGLPYSVLSDHTYRYYRSSSGRASLQFAALELCENYRNNHPQYASIYYEDKNLIIYHFRLPEDSKVL